MSQIFDCIKTRSQITNLQKTDTDQLAFSTKLHGVKLFSSNTCVIKHDFSNQFLDHNTTATAFSNSGNLLAFATKKAIYVADIIKKEILKIIPIDSFKIEVMIFDHSSKYIIAGNENGRVVQYNCFSSSMLSRLCSFPYDQIDRTNIKQNYVSSLATSKNKLATSGLGGAVIIIDIDSRVNNIVFENNTSRVDALCFVNDDLLVGANEDGVVSIYSTKDKKIIKQIDTPLTKIKQIIPMGDPNFIMLNSNTNFLSVVDIKNYKLIHHKLVEFKDRVTHVASMDKTCVAVALDSGEIKKVELANEDELRSYILHNSLDKAYELVEKEPMLQHTNTYEELEMVYEKIYNRALNALIKQNLSLAKEILKDFTNLGLKSKQISSLFISLGHYEDLIHLYANRKISLAYAMISKYKELEKTPVYRKLEEIWRDDFKNAQKYMLKNRISTAETLLQKYKTVESKKEMVKLVLNQNKEFVKFVLALDKRDYAQASKIASSNKLLTKAPLYEKLQNELDYKVDQIKTFIYQGDIDKAKIAISIIEDVSGYEEQTQLFLKECKNLELLQTHYENNNFKECYETIDKHPTLKFTQLGELLEKHWGTLVQKCEFFALKGNLSGVKKTLGSLITLDSRVEKIGDLIRLSFHVRIKDTLSKRSFRDAEGLIYRYTDAFGKDHEIGELMSKYEAKTQNKLAITQDSTLKRNSWLDIIDELI